MIFWDFVAYARQCKPMPPGQGALKPFRLDDDVEERAWRESLATRLDAARLRRPK